jgi:hypothetical protein
VPIFHVVSKNDSKTFRDVLTAIKRAGIATEVVPADQWLDRLHKAQKEGSEHVSLKMLDMWQKAVSSLKIGHAAMRPGILIDITPPAVRLLTRSSRIRANLRDNSRRGTHR